MKRAKVAVFFFFLLFLPVAASAVTLGGESRTYLQFRETQDSDRITPIYEYLDFKVLDLGRGEFSFHFGGWLRYRGEEDQVFSKKFNSDLQYAYLSYKGGTGNSVVNLGRLFISEGVALEQIDGLYARTDLKAGFGIAAFGGVPVETDFDKRSDDWVYGTRLTHGVPGLYKVGVSFLKEDNDGSDFREEFGLDLRVTPVKKVEFFGRSSYNSLTDGWMEHAYRISVGPFSGFRLTPEISWIDYKNYFTAETTSAFNFLNASVDSGEKVLILGGNAQYMATDTLSVSADYRNYDYDIAGNASYYGGKIAYSAAGSGGAGFAVHRMSGQSDRLKYNEFRLYGYKKIGKAADITVDLFDVSYDNRINDVKNAYAVVVAAGYNLTKNARLAADIEYARNPFFDKEVKAFLKFLYQFSFAGQKKGV